MSDNKNKTDGIVTFLNQYKNEAELKVFAEAQMNTIMELKRKLDESEKARQHLEKQLDGKAPIVIVKEDGDLQDQHAIAVMQLARLRDVSLGRELTLEEARKLEIYDKIVSRKPDERDATEVPYKKMSEDELLAVASEVKS